MAYGRSNGILLLMHFPFLNLYAINPNNSFESFYTCSVSRLRPQIFKLLMMRTCDDVHVYVYIVIGSQNSFVI